MQKDLLQKEYQLYRNGGWYPASNGATFKATCPANGEELATCAEATAEDVDQAVKDAWIAWKTWKDTTPTERAALLCKIADVIDANTERLAMIETMDNGKALRETTLVDVPSASDHFRYFAAAIRAEEGTVNMIDNNTMSLVIREPIGVVGQIVPWNFPFLMAAWKLAPVLASGCCTILKPSSETSLSMLEFARLIDGILPPGVFNVLTGKGSRCGNYILQHPDLAKLAFTGSTEVGVAVAKAAADKLIPATLELGGKSANIFFADCNWELAMEGLQMGILFNQGQVCCAGSRVFVQEDIYDKFLAEAIKHFNAIKVGLPWEKGVQMGSQIYAAQVKKVLDYVELAKSEGATIACGGYRLTENGLDKGNFVAPTLITNANNKMRVAQEEIFGPVAVVIPFKTEKEVVEMANDSVYGLGGAVWTQDINRAIRVARAVRTGRMWVNSYNAIPAGAPFGGYKQSGIGRETHKVMLDHYTQTKNIMINLSEKPLGFY
ncbi:MAG: aldehyde dehydrogenase family protein [Acidaminococcaceae bacterium]|nr:aldehyde dehydrogenase family protein [Acidaminococcaceae bacterium]